MSLAKFRQFSIIISLCIFSMSLFSPLLQDLNDSNVRSFVIVPQISEALIILFFSLLPLFLLKLSNFYCSIFQFINSLLLSFPFCCCVYFISVIDCICSSKSFHLALFFIDSNSLLRFSVFQKFREFVIVHWSIFFFFSNFFSSYLFIFGCAGSLLWHTGFF